MIKLPIELTSQFLVSVRYRYGKTPRLIFETKNKNKPCLEKGNTYWVPEKYRLVSGQQGKMVQYFNDVYKAETPDWVEFSKMRKAYSRYALECVNVESKKINKLTKKEVVLNGTFAERIPQKIDDEITDEFKKKSYELWRFKNSWNSYAKEGAMWEDNPEIYIYHVVLHRLEPEYVDYRQHNWGG